jgi:hypothetical protein
MTAKKEAEPKGGGWNSMTFNFTLTPIIPEKASELPLLLRPNRAQC